MPMVVDGPELCKLCPSNVINCWW